MPRLYMRKENEVGVRPPSARQWTRRAAGACAMHETSHSNPRVDRPPPRPRPHASRRGPQHPHSTSVLLSPDGKPDESKRHGWWHFAATLVQSRWRGWAGRRRYLRHRRAARIIQANYRRWRARCMVRANHPRRFVVQTPPLRLRNENTRTHTSLLPSSSARTQAIARLRAARDAAATRIARAWRRHVPRARYRALRNLARAWSRMLHPSTMLRHSGAPNDAAMTSDVAAQTHVRLALIARCNGGDDAKHDAVLVYRVCTHGPVVDVGGRNVGEGSGAGTTRTLEIRGGASRTTTASCGPSSPGRRRCRGGNRARRRWRRRTPCACRVRGRGRSERRTRRGARGPGGGACSGWEPSSRMTTTTTCWRGARRSTSTRSSARSSPST